MTGSESSAPRFTQTEVLEGVLKNQAAAGGFALGGLGHDQHQFFVFILFEQGLEAGPREDPG